MLTVGIFLFDEVEVLDFAGPFEVLSTAGRVAQRSGAEVPFRVLLIGQTQTPVRARGGLLVTPHHAFFHHPHLDVVLIPGGDVSVVQNDAEVVRWTKAVSATAMLTVSVCTGAFVLGAAGLLAGRRVTTHWEDVADLRQAFPEAQVEADQRFIDEGTLVTSAGISAGIDMSLHLVRRFTTEDLAQRTARQMDYAWQDAPAP